MINMLNTIAYKCPVCGSFEFSTFLIFDFLKDSSYTIKCSCKKAFVKIITKAYKRCEIKVPCFACNDIHAFELDFKSLLYRKNIFNFKCPRTNMDLCFIGEDNEVRESVDKYEMQMERLMHDLGYEDDFVNSTVMLNTVDKIHDIAEKGNLYCQCGSKDINLQMFRDRILLTCNKCFTYENIYAGKNSDLKRTLTREYIILCDNIRGASPWKYL